MLGADVIQGDRTSDVSAHQEQTRRLVRAMMTLTGQTASGLARAAGLTPSTVNRFMHRPVRHTLSQRTMLALMTETFLSLKRRPPRELNRRALDELVPAIAVYEKGILEYAPEAADTLVQVKAAATARPVAERDPAPLSPLPVVLTSTQDVDIRQREVSRAPLTTPRPPFLAADPLAFAILMPNDSMTPRFDSGDLLYVNPGRALDGDHVDVVVERAGGGFVIGTLISSSTESVRISSLSPKARESFARSKVRGVYRIVGVQRLGA